MRSVASACVYGQKGAQADGSGVKLILTAHNFGYVGSGQDFTNDPSLAVQANEVEELNNGKVLYSSTDQDGDFRVGDAFTVDQETGNVAFAATSTAQSAANITLSDATGTTNIFPAYIETGNLRLAGNSITSTTGQVIVDPSGEEDFVVNAETIVKDAIYFDVNKSISFGSTTQGSLKIGGFGGSTVFGSSEASTFSTRALTVIKNGLGTVNITGAGTGYTGGVQPTTVITEPFQKATITNTIKATGGVKRVNLTNRGSGYTTEPTVAFSSGTAVGDAVLATGGKVESITIDDGGTGYTSGTISVAIDPATQNSFSAGSTTVSTSASTVTLSGHPLETGDEVTYSDGGGTAITELTDGRNYHVINLTANTLSLANTYQDATRGTAISLTDGDSENHTITATNTHAGTVTLVQNDVIIIDKKPSDTIAASGTMTGTAIGNQP